MKRRDVALLREGQTFATIQRAIWDITNEQFFLVNQRQLNNWVKIVDKLEGCVIARTAKRIRGGGRSVHYMQYDVALYQWFSDRRAQNQPVTARQLNDEAQRIASVDGRMVSRRWLEKFRKRHSIVLRKCQRKTQLSAAERTARLQKFYAYIYLQPSTISVWVNFDEIPATLAGVMGSVQTLEHAGTANVMVNFQESHFKRMGTLIAMLGVKKQGDLYCAVKLKPAVLLKCKKSKVVQNPHQLQCVTNATGVINTQYMRDHFIPYLQAQLQNVGGECIIILDSASAHISQAVLQALRHCGLRYAVIPGGLTMFIQSIDTALAALYRSAHHRLYVSHMEHQAKLTAAQQRDLFVELCYSGLTAATANLDVPAIFRDLGYIDPSKAKLRIPYQFAPPEVQPQNAAAAKPKPKPKARARQLSMATFLAPK